jgi:TatD DNase family protein
MPLVDTHCHIHSQDYPLDAEEMLAKAIQADVTGLICVGTTAEDSELAVQFAASHDNCWASIGLHPHDAKIGEEAFATLQRLASESVGEAVTPQPSPDTISPPASLVVTTPVPKAPPIFSSKEDKYGVPSFGPPVTNPEAIRPEEDTNKKVSHALSLQSTAIGPPTPKSPLERSEAVTEEFGGRVASEKESVTSDSSRLIAIGECGLDYFYNHSSKEDQAKALRFQIELALEYNLPMIFHVREAFDDFWPIFDSYQGIRGVLHSFTDNRGNFDEAMSRGLYIGVNGIMTFTKNDWQLDIVKAIPANRLLLETDAPFLTPTPLRGNINEPANVSHVCRFVSQLRQEPTDELANGSTQNAIDLFAL